MNQRPCIIFSANTDWYFYNFRKALVDRVQDQGYDVILVSPAGKYADRLKALGYRCEQNDFGGAHGKNVFANAQSMRKMLSLYRAKRPVLVHHFTIKCVLYGGISARLLRIPTVNAVTGIGHLFTNDRMINRVLRIPVSALYKIVCGGPRSRTIFQNEEDQRFFLSRKFIRTDQSVLIRGSGADCNRFKPTELPRPAGPVRVVFASRLLREKGIRELVEACNRLRSDGLEFELIIAGQTSPEHPSSLTDQELVEFGKHAKLVGHTDDVKTLLDDADIVALPSYAEGTPRILLEAGASGKPLIATDIAGCRGIVQDGANGFLVPVRDSEAVERALRRLIESEDLRKEFAVKSRQIVLEEFSEEIVNPRTIDVYRDLIDF